MKDAISRSQQGQLLTLYSLLPPAAENDVLLEIAMRLRADEGLRYDRRMMLNNIPIIESYDQIPDDLYLCHNTRPPPPPSLCMSFMIDEPSHR